MATKPVVKTDEEAAAVELTALVEIANEVNIVLGLNPPIDTTQEADPLLAQIKLETSQIGMADGVFAEKVYNADKAAFSPETWAWLEANGCVDHLKAPLEALAAKPAAAPAGRAASAAPAAAPAEPAYTRVNGMIDAIKTGGTVAELIAAADANLVAKGKKTATASIKADLDWLGVILAGVGAPVSIDKDGRISIG
jgi:hypothetical protein